MEWENKKEMIQLGNVMNNGEPTTESKPAFQKYVLEHINEFDIQAWDMFFDIIEIIPEEIEQDKYFHSKIYRIAKEIDDRKMNILSGLRTQMRWEVYIHVCQTLGINKLVKTEIIPVIHMLNESQVFANIAICIECGIQKVFLINHMVSVSDLINCALKVKEQNPNLWVGINMLGQSPEISLGLGLGLKGGIDGIWCDETITSKISSFRKFEGMVFGGLAFKYQPQPYDYNIACKEAILNTDVATTSGNGTGQPANINKIKNIREFLVNHPMAIASGVSVDNIDNYKGIADYLLVASSITGDNEMIIKEKLIELKSKI
jgi:hypothetical protein